MIYLTCSTNDEDEPDLITAGIGLMCQPGNSYHLRVGRYPFYGADNGCFAARWKEDAWLRWLEPMDASTCLFAVAPDVYPDAEATLERSRHFFDLIREMGFPVALVAQDGAEHLDLPWDDFDALFIGGEQKPGGKGEWKVSDGAAALVRRARLHGKWVHMGRVNSMKRIAIARGMGCNSADGRFIAFRRRKRARDEGDERESRGAAEVDEWGRQLYMTPPIPIFSVTEGHALEVHRRAALAEHPGVGRSQSTG